MRRVIVIAVAIAVLVLLWGSAAGCGSVEEPPPFPTTTPELFTFTVDDWELAVLMDTGGPATPLRIDAGRVAWRRNALAGYPAGIFLYDLASGTITTLLEGVDTQSIDLRGNLLVYSTAGARENWMDIWLLDLSTRRTKRVRMSPSWALDPQLNGDFVVWRETRYFEKTERLMSYNLASEETQILADITEGSGAIGEYWVSDRWVVFNWRAVRLGSEEAPRRLPAGAKVQCLDGDQLYYVFDANEAHEVSELHRLDLASGDDELIASGSEYQSVRADGDRFAWATWEEGRAAVVFLDRASGREIHIPAPDSFVGGLRLEGNILLWERVPAPPQPTTDLPHLFVYDIARDATTDLSLLYHYEQSWSTDGEAVVFPERRVPNGPVRIIVAQPGH